MRYDGMIYRPPSEAYSLIIQVTVGCSHNKCTFCNMYKNKKFRIRRLAEIFQDLEMARRYYKNVKKIFLADGDALILKYDDLEKILISIKKLFPECERVATYATPKDILRKNLEELKKLKELGLKIVYLGMESGCDKVLENINKGVTSSEIIEAGKKVKASGIKLSVTMISGLGGKEYFKEHAADSAKVISEIDPDYLGLLTLMVDKKTSIYKDIKDEKITLLSPIEIMIETREFIKKINVSKCVFRSNHASNYAPLAATLNKEKSILLQQLDYIIDGNYNFKDEYFRSL